MDNQAWGEQQPGKRNICREKHVKNKGSYPKTFIKTQLYRTKVLRKYFPLQ